MALTQAQLLAQQSQSDLRASLDAKFAAIPLDVSSWTPSSQGGIENANGDAVCAEIAAYGAPIVARTARSHFLDRGTGDEVTIDAEKFFRLPRHLAQPTIQTIKLTLIKGGPTYDYEAGELWFKSRNGNQYRSSDAFHIQEDPSIPTKVTTKIRAYCTTPGAKANQDVAGTILEMETPLPGVTCKNVAASDWSAAVLAGASSGTITPTFRNGTPPPSTAYSTLKVRIDASGDAEAGSFSISTDGGASWVSKGAMHSGIALDAYTQLLFANGPTHPSFLFGNIFSFAVADAIVQRGTDDEPDAALRRRCRNRWPSLSDVPTSGLVDLWAHQASVEVDRVLVDADEVNAGWMHVRIAAVDGRASDQAISDVQTYITNHLSAQSGGFEHASVSSVDVLVCTVFAVISIPQDKLAAAQVAANEAWIAYLQSVPIGGQVLFSALAQAIMNADPAIDYDSLSSDINGIPNGTGFVQLSPAQIAVSAVGGLFNCTWLTT